MPTIEVVYTGYAPAVEGGGFLFPRNEPVSVPSEVAETLGPDFQPTSIYQEGE